MEHEEFLGCILTFLTFLSSSFLFLFLPFSSSSCSSSSSFPLSPVYLADSEKRSRKRKSEVLTRNREPRKINKLTVTVKDLIQSGVIDAGQDVLKIDYSVPRLSVVSTFFGFNIFLSLILTGEGVCRLVDRRRNCSVSTPQGKKDSQF